MQEIFQEEACLGLLVVLDTDSISVLQNIAAITSFNFECTVSKIIMPCKVNLVLG